LEKQALKDLPGESLLERLKTFAEQFAASRLNAYIEWLRKSPHVATTPKEINDAIWGTVKLQPLEVIILDSPLVQRLRFIRQLGVVHWIYPGATHARFEHTLGVLFQAQQLVAAINQASGLDATAAPIDPHKSGLIRLCALLHDIGHGVFSHVSEHALIKRPDFRLALTAFTKINSLEKVQLSELMAYYLIGSPSFVDLLELALDRLGQPIRLVMGSRANAEEISKLIQRAIIGQIIDDQVPLLHEIITGPFDADKLDYYVRDARLSGVPPMLDISRLTQKITVERMTTANLPPGLAKAVSSQFSTHYLFGLKWSGAPILDELHLARVLLFSKIYRHKKVLAAEAMIEALMDALGASDETSPEKLLALCYEFSDDQLLWSTGPVVLSAAGIAKPSKELALFVADVIRRLRDRALYVSALSIRSRYPADPWEHDTHQERGLSDLVQDLKNPSRAKEFKAALLDELTSLATAYPSALGTLDSRLLSNSVVVSAKPPLSGGTEIDRAFIFQGGRPIPYRDLSGVSQPAWANAYDFSAAAAMLFCPRECSAAVYVAAERLIRSRYGAILPNTALDLSKQDLDSVIGLKRALEAAGWYDGVDLDIRPKPIRLTRGDAATKIEDAAGKIELFDEPSAPPGQRRPAALTSRVEQWLSQFRSDDFIECAMVLLEKLRLLGREDTRRALAAFAEANPGFRGGTISVLGGFKDSSAVQAYLSRDLEEIFPRTATVEEAAARGYDGPIVFLDDFIGSGRQATDILGNWFEMPDLTQPQLDERRLPFRKNEQDYLRDRPVGFVFLAGWDEGLNTIRSVSDTIGLKAEVYAELGEASIPFAFENALSELDPETVEEFKEKCRDIGQELLRTEGKSEEKIAERALGYGNRAMLLASRYNVPTQSLTCLWKSGQVRGVDWHALLTRRDKS
jgi:HD superfamily phosphohydrolase